VLGPPGSTHDLTAFKESCALKDAAQLFHEGEWLWADSVYALSPWCMVPYKHPQSLIPSNCQFNYHLSTVSCMPTCIYKFSIFALQVHIRSEHAVGHLKDQFQSLCGLLSANQFRVQVYAYPCMGKACLIVHSFAACHEDHKYESDGLMRV
jgi:hypothetical protein